MRSGSAKTTAAAPHCVYVCVCVIKNYHNVEDGVLAVEARRRVHLQLEEFDAKAQVLIRRCGEKELPATRGK